MLRPTAIEFGLLFVAEFNDRVTLLVIQTVPERRRQLRTHAGRKLLPHVFERHAFLDCRSNELPDELIILKIPAPGPRSNRCFARSLPFRKLSHASLW